MSALRIFVRVCLAVAALSGLGLTGLWPAAADELVKFDAAAKPADSARGPALQGYLTRPNGRGPFPAVVLLHSCLGLPAARRSIGEALARWGYVALFVDDFSTRRIKETCAVDFPEGVSDAFGALAFLARLPFVDPKRIAAVGYSQGADTALQIASSRFAAAFEVPDGARFKAAAAFYPPCANLGGAALKIPTLVLVGELDDVTPAADCERLGEAQPGGSSRMKLVVYPRARHGFDNPEFAGGVRVSGMWLAYDRGAAERSRSELRDFLAAEFAP